MNYSVERNLICTNLRSLSVNGLIIDLRSQKTNVVDKLVNAISNKLLL